jgi:hypothetical protein
MNKSTPLTQLQTQPQPQVQVQQQNAPLNDDDVVVQDILNQINGGNIGDSVPSQTPQQHYYPPPPIHPPPQMQQPMQMPSIPQQPTGQEIENYMLYFADDLKLGGLVFTITILVHFIPVDKYVSKYFNIQNIPYHEVILRAIMIALFVVLIKKFAKI